MSWLIFFNHPLSFNNNNDNENDNDNNNDLLTDPLGGSSLLNYINYNCKIKQINYLQIMQYVFLVS